MTKSDTIIELKKQKIVAVIRGNTKEEGLQASIACIKGGIKAIEIAYTNQYAGQIIKELVDLYQDDQSVCIGAGTVLDAGSEIIKLFPGSTLSPAYISAVKAPIPQVSVMVTGGVGLNNIPQWFAAGADAVGIGGELNKLASQGNFDRISEIAQQYITLR
ncbi:keto-hydroxyglutarate-aldolase/keto-deoxy-phosphogluconate aldolase [Streptococcus pneumoniae]|uniref:keto-deoxy-phosphogluconate aldolase n=1 Tax=Streptococcus pneumoniae TaxID=1313 RepID=UPI0005E02C18|nr:keto-deoxy-phosphogluconate aldolase [Streptococcus pneumoniae]CJE56631.1 keto-hydroxyglutarate-aldolase/keto-deoxy-phosphogluconate aldolase [Streptococcus pneumoniae]